MCWVQCNAARSPCTRMILGLTSALLPAPRLPQRHAHWEQCWHCCAAAFAANGDLLQHNERLAIGGRYQKGNGGRDHLPYDQDSQTPGRFSCGRESRYRGRVSMKTQGCLMGAFPGCSAAEAARLACHRSTRCLLLCLGRPRPRSLSGLSRWTGEGPFHCTTSLLVFERYL